MEKIQFKNGTNLKFTDISSEEYREYEFIKDGEKVKITIKNPLFLNVSPAGGHRIFDGDGISHYLPKGWVHLIWKAKAGEPSFVK